MYSEEVGRKKKTDEVTPDDPHDSEEEDSADDMEDGEKVCLTLRYLVTLTDVLLGGGRGNARTRRGREN